MKKRLTGFLMGAALFLCLTGCQDALRGPQKEEKAPASSGQESSDQEQPVTAEIYAMDTYMTVVTYGERADEAAKAAEEEIRRLDALLSTGNPDSEVSRINREGGGVLSEDTAVLMEYSLAIQEKTDGAFNAAMYPLMEAWGFAGGEFRVPDEKERKELLKQTEPSCVHYDKEKRTLTLSEGTRIDFGGIAKGYTSSRLMDIFRSYGLASAMVNLGGNVHVYGSKTDGSDWKVAITDPSDTQAYLGIAAVSDRAVITSGGYERFFEKDGVIYHHILDPKTGSPARSGLISATIVSADGTLADALSTGCYVLGKEKAEALWRANPGEFEMILCTEDHEIFVTEGLKDSFTSDNDFVIIEW